MQHTDKYQLNLIETSDTFSPAPLNENAHKLEDALETARAEAAAGDAALDQRLQVFEAKRFACGTYRPSPSAFSISLGFRPRVVFIMAFETFLSGAIVDGQQSKSGAVTDDGFSVSGHGSSSTTNINAAGTFAYIAFA